MLIFCDAANMYAGLMLDIMMLPATDLPHEY